MIPVNDLKRSYSLFSNEYDEKALTILKSGWYILGKEVEAFEKEFAKALGSDFLAVGGIMG